MSLADLTIAAVEAALDEYDAIGQKAFLAKYGFGDSKRYWLLARGKQYPSKAIAGVAHKYLSGAPGPLRSADFVGGQVTVVKKLKHLGFDIEVPSRNPDWARDELILAMDLYFTNPSNPPGKTSTAVAELSNLLNKMHRISGGRASLTFRNADGVYMKMMNIRSIDPAFVAQGKKGMKAGGSLEKAIWLEYQGRLPALQIDANAIRKAIIQADESAISKLPLADDYEGEEGGVLLRLHKRYERDPRLVTEKRKAALKAGKLSCEVCQFNFKSTYGELGEGYIEVHHIKPVHMMKPGSKTKLDDLALLCANCHRMAHRKREPLSLAEIAINLTK